MLCFGAEQGEENGVGFIYHLLGRLANIDRHLGSQVMAVYRRRSSDVKCGSQEEERWCCDQPYYLGAL